MPSIGRRSRGGGVMRFDGGNMSYQQSFEAVPGARVVAEFPGNRLAARGAAGKSVVDRLRVSVHGDLAEIEAEWRRFEATAECTVFQTFAWQCGWQRHIGGAAGSRPASSSCAILQARS